jgi:hypothetical protein
VGLAVAAACAAQPSRAVDLTSGDWKFSVNGNINVDYIQQCRNKGAQW